MSESSPIFGAQAGHGTVAKGCVGESAEVEP